MRRGITIIFMLTILLGCELLGGKVYYVSKVKSYYPYSDKNTQAYLIVYKNGKSGHVEEVFCEFPPNFLLKGNEKDGWTGIEKVRVKGKAREWLMGSVSYYCEEEK